jgi:cobalt-zinc-cadmium efflux system membrane fusion protein
MKSTILLGLLCATAVSCGGAVDRPASEEPVEQPAEPGVMSAEPNLVHVDPAMLRDLRITTAAVEQRSDREHVTLCGELGVDERAYAEVGAPVPARVTRLLAAEGDTVRAGQDLAELQSADLGRARSEYLEADARVTLAERALSRKQELAAERIAPQREVQEAEAEAAAARASLRAASAALAALGEPTPDSGSATRDAASLVLRSPVSGTVLERHAVLGQMLDPQEPAFRIGNLGTLWLTVHAFEGDAVRIVTNTAARLTFPALPGQEFPGTVTLVGRQVERASRTVPIRIEVRNRDEALRPGMSATAALPVGVAEQPIMTVPVAAVQRVREAWAVFLPGESGAFEIRTIGRGRDLGGEVEVLSGLSAGEEVVVDGAFLLKAQAEMGEAALHAH